jgi:hypothetical protein
MRKKLPSSREKRVLIKNRHCCCICQNDGYGKEVEIHHIDGNNSNNIESNLAVLCLIHASQADAGLKKGKLGTGKKLKPDAVRQYKRIWERKMELEMQHRKKIQRRSDVGSRGELKRLMRESLAASRCGSEGVNMFKQKVIEIDLLDNVSSDDKVSAFHQLGQEVALNSDRGTVILTDKILWQIVSSGGNSRKLLKHIAETLWDIGLNAVEYDRGKDTIQTVANAILEVSKQSRINNSHDAVVDCKNGLDSMLAMARKDKHVHLVDLLEHAVKSLAEGPQCSKM